MTTSTSNNFLGETSMYPNLQDKLANNNDILPSAPLDQTKFAPHGGDQPFQKERNKKILNDIKYLEEKLNHYNKVKRKWSKANTTFNILSIIIGSSATIVTLVSTSGFIIIPLYVTSLVALSGVTETILIQSLSCAVLEKNKKLYQSICNEIRNTISKLYIYHQKALNDGIIDEKELEQIEQIILNLEETINKIKNKQDIKVKSKKLNQNEINKLKELLK